jgi:hypothetical protein
MDRRNLLAGVVTMVASLFLVAGTAFGHTATAAPLGNPTAKGPCAVHSLPSFIDQGEGFTASSVADIIEVECEPGYEEASATISSQELQSRCHTLIWGRINQITGEWEGIKSPKVTTVLDNADNATVVVFGGPSCSTGSSLVSAHLNEAPAETFTTNFAVLQPQSSKPGITALDPPATSTIGNGMKVEDSNFSDVATIVQLEFEKRYAEKEVILNAEQLYFDCPVGTGLSVHVTAVGPEGFVLALAGEEGVVRLPKFSPFTLNNNGNAFVVLLASQSCTPATLGIEASVNAPPGFTTYETPFTVLEPQATFGK